MVVLVCVIGCVDVVFGTVVSGCLFDLFGVEWIIGLLVNTVLIWVCIEENQCFGELFRSV